MRNEAMHLLSNGTPQSCTLFEEGGGPAWNLRPRIWGKVAILGPSAAARVMDYTWNSPGWHHKRWLLIPVQTQD